jgi:hypothetical protein
MKNTFRKSTKMSNAAIAVCFLAAILVTPLSLALWKATGVELFHYSGIMCVCVAVAGIFIALLGQSVNQILRGWAYVNRKEAGFFEGEKPIISKSVLGRFGFARRMYKLPGCNINISRSRDCHARGNVRSHRSASRRTFTHASKSSGGNSDDGGSDQPDSDDPAGLNTPQDFHLCTKKHNKTPLLWPVYANRHVPSPLCFERGRLA